MITTVTGKNQVTVPVDVAAKVGIHRGSRLEWKTTDRADIIEVRVLPDAAAIAASLLGRGAQDVRDHSPDSESA